MELEWSASDILARLKAGLKNEDTRIEGSFSMDNMQAVSEELARYNSMLIKPLWDEIDLRIDEVITSGNENHYAFWARQVENAEGKRVIGSARVHGVRDGSGIVHVALLTPEAGAPTPDVVELVRAYIETQRPVGAQPVIRAAEAVEVTINGIIELQEGADMESVRAQAGKEVKSYLAEVALEGKKETVLNYYRIGMLIGGTPGVKEIVEYTVNEGGESMTADYDQFLTLKGLTLNASG